MFDNGTKHGKIPATQTKALRYCPFSSYSSSNTFHVAQQLSALLHLLEHSRQLPGRFCAIAIKDPPAKRKHRRKYCPAQPGISKRSPESSAGSPGSRPCSYRDEPPASRFRPQPCDLSFFKKIPLDPIAKPEQNSFICRVAVPQNFFCISCFRFRGDLFSPSYCFCARLYRKRT